MELQRAASDPKFSGVAGEGALVSFLDEAALLSRDGEQARKQPVEEETAAAGAGAGGGRPTVAGGQAVSPPMIQLMTIHASKGLEFDTVFLTGCEDGSLPSSRATTEEELDEERRLM